CVSPETICRCNRVLQESDRADADRCTWVGRPRGHVPLRSSSSRSVARYLRACHRTRRKGIGGEPKKRKGESSNCELAGVDRQDPGAERDSRGSTVESP